MTLFPRVLPVGDAALTVELGDAIEATVNARVRGLDRSLRDDPVDGLLETVPTHRSLLVLYDSRRARFADVGKAVLDRLAHVSPAADPGALHVVPTRYGGDDGPDLAAVARRAGLSEAETVALHSGCEYTASMLGFTPGFAYLGRLPEPLWAPRQATPRARVPAGSVAVAGSQTGVYPSASPGGWSVIGRTSLRLFDPGAASPALIQPGDRVRFVSARDLPPAPPPAPPMAAAGLPRLELLEGGLLTTVQAGGRHGHRRVGVASAGPMDAPSHHAANALVANLQDAAALECTISGPQVRFLATTAFAITGADLGAVLRRADIGEWPVPLGTRVLARAGNVLAFRGRRAGCRAYVAFAGGILVPEVLGSRSTDLTGGFGGFEGRALRGGDRIVVGNAAAPARPVPHWSPGPSVATATVRVILGPQADHIAPDSVERFLSQTYAVTSVSDRVGCRLSGTPLRHLGSPEIVTDGMVFGSIQIPPDGQPIVMMADAPTTGGYPKIGTVVTADLPLLAQLAPGEGHVSFRSVTVDEAQAT